MRAVVLEEFGPPDVLQLRSLPDPEPGPGQVLIRIAACGVNRRDAWVRAGLRSRELPRILGCDIAGTIVATGPGVNPERIGTDVVVYPVLSCRCCLACAVGDSHLCSSVGLLGAEADGGYCELIALDEFRVLPAPPALGLAQAAALPIVYTTAWQMLRRARLRPGESILVWGASSGLGQATLELALLFRPALIVTTARNNKLVQASKLGADAVLAYDQDDVAERVLELTAGRGVDVVIDHVGSRAWPIDLAVLARGGRVALAGATTGNEVAIPVLQFLGRGLEVIGCFVGSRRDFAEVVRLAAEGLVLPVVETVRLEEAAEAHRRLESGENFGKLVLTAS